MSAHSSEPWVLGMNAAQGSKTLVMASNVVVADCAPDWCEDGPEESNARRIAACVNACRGIPIDDLERFSAEADKHDMSIYMGFIGYYLASKRIDGQPITENPTMEPL